jgi:hypothetical protein
MLGITWKIVSLHEIIYTSNYGIVGLHIETKQIFKMVEVITCLRWFWLGIRNLDKIMSIMKS